MRTCEQCSKNIGDRHGNAKNCVSCSMPKYNKKRIISNNKCKSCDASIGYRRKTAKWCEKCSFIARREYMRQLMAKKSAASVEDGFSSYDMTIIRNHHMIGLGTFEMGRFYAEDMANEFRIIRKLKKHLGLN